MIKKQTLVIYDADGVWKDLNYAEVARFVICAAEFDFTKDSSTL